MEKKNTLLARPYGIKEKFKIAGIISAALLINFLTLKVIIVKLNVSILCAWYSSTSN